MRRAVFCPRHGPMIKYGTLGCAGLHICADYRVPPGEAAEAVLVALLASAYAVASRV